MQSRYRFKQDQNYAPRIQICFPKLMILVRIKQNYELRGGLTSYFSALPLGDEGLLEIDGLQHVHQHPQVLPAHRDQLTLQKKRKKLISLILIYFIQLRVNVR
jgi:hypothetical protein